MRVRKQALLKMQKRKPGLEKGKDEDREKQSGEEIRIWKNNLKRKKTLG